MKARVTVISSGDNEDYAHPRPGVFGASARYGREAKAASGELMPPLLYSTELARSVRLAFAGKIREADTPGSEVDAAKVEIREAKQGARFEPLDETPISTDLIYGLINIRTDGETVICAYMKEQGRTSTSGIQGRRRATAVRRESGRGESPMAKCSTRIGAAATSSCFLTMSRSGGHVGPAYHGVSGSPASTEDVVRWMSWTSPASTRLVASAAAADRGDPRRPHGRGAAASPRPAGRPRSARP